MSLLQGSGPVAPTPLRSGGGALLQFSLVTALVRRVPYWTVSYPGGSAVIATAPGT